MQFTTFKLKCSFLKGSNQLPAVILKPSLASYYIYELLFLLGIIQERSEWSHSLVHQQLIKRMQTGIDTHNIYVLDTM